ncbi:MAG: MAPEG family protein [Dokdonella sp.]|uniref:MAPEG family protein n=1 Tax=Dokdonella sp. TaxID=2291710 RepID=UPI0025C16B16|nr:MAPEG family protein [Dokdonella sp.]MBZ0222605.1 MAPEG family protein [Dokdonella sp.]MCC7254998.1 MAPEG family protein [Dokdonella sp.]
MSHLPELVTLLNVLLLFATALAVGYGRHRYRIKAPATSGHPQFECIFRVQMNTLENTVVFLPALWLAALHGFAQWAGIAGLVWLAGRIWFMVAYLRRPESRGPAYVISMLAWTAVVVMAAWGVGGAMLAG